ncbi:ribosomal protein L7/L12 [Terriglobus aquaticus]|nr:ribosomal protein L7/L12 [Terriglobus aquaticus]
MAFVLGVLFGRLTSRSGTSGHAHPLAPGSPDLDLGRPSAISSADAPGGPYAVTLLDQGSNLIRTIKMVREVKHLGLKDAKDFVESAPRPLIRVASADQANAIVRAFQGVASVRVDGPEGVHEVKDYGYSQFPPPNRDTTSAG